MVKMSWERLRLPRIKTISIRPTKEQDRFIEKYRIDHKLQSKGDAIKHLIEAFQSEPQQQADWEKKTPEELKKEWLESLKEAAENKLDCIWGIWEEFPITVLCRKKENRGSKPYVSLPFEMCKKCFIANRARIDKERKEKEEKKFRKVIREPAHSSIDPTSFPYGYSELDEKYGRAY